MGREMKIFEMCVAPQTDPFPFTLLFLRVDEHDDPIVDDDGDDLIESHVFSALGDPGSAGMAFVTASSVRYNDRGEQVVDLSGILRFFRRALPSDDYIRLNDLLDRQDLRISMDQLVEVYQWLGEEYMGRPTREQRRSSNTPRGTGRRSTGSRSSRAAT